MSAAIERRSSSSDFTIVQQLGSGSYGKVYKVTRKSDGMPYAIKEVNIKKLQPREREDAVNEIRILASIKHKNIVRYCDAFLEKDNLFIVMEFAEHGDISRQTEKFKKANKYIKEDTVWSYLIQIAHALEAMHSRNVLHRDIKPKNVFLTGKNHVRLGDLGCAKLMKAGLARTQIGTPYYMSPEIWMNRPYDAKSDVWALGCLVYELAQLAPPFLANDMNGLSAKVKTAPAPPISKHYSDDLRATVALMLSKDPKARPDIRSLLASPAVVARLGTLPTDEEGHAWAGEDLRAHMLATIKLPSGFGYGGVRAGGAGGLNLPAPSFPHARPPADAGAAAARAGAPAAAPPAPAAAAAAAAAPPAPAAPPAGPPAAAARAAFAAATSPPHLGRPAPPAAAAGDENAPVAAAAGAKAGCAPGAAPLVAKRPLSAAPGPVANAAPAPHAGGKAAAPPASRPPSAAGAPGAGAGAGAGARAPAAPSGARAAAAPPLPSAGAGAGAGAGGRHGAPAPAAPVARPAAAIAAAAAMGGRPAAAAGAAAAPGGRPAPALGGSGAPAGGRPPAAAYPPHGHNAAAAYAGARGAAPALHVGGHGRPGPSRLW